MGFWLNVAGTTVTVTVLWIVVSSGVVAVAWGHTIINIAFFFVEIVLVQRILGLRWPAYLARLLRPTAASAVMGLCVAGLYLGLEAVSSSGVVELVVLVLAGIAAYAVVWLLMAPRYVRSLWRLLAGRGGAVA